jgi:hypothetical protein
MTRKKKYMNAGASRSHDTVSDMTHSSRGAIHGLHRRRNASAGELDINNLPAFEVREFNINELHNHSKPLSSISQNVFNDNSHDTLDDNLLWDNQIGRSSSDRHAFPGSYRTHDNDINNPFGVHGFDVYGYDVYGYDRDGFTIHGLDRNGMDRNGEPVLRNDGYDRNGLDRNGEPVLRNDNNNDGYDRNGFDIRGLDRNGEPVPIPPDLFDDDNNDIGEQHHPLLENDNFSMDFSASIAQNEYSNGAVLPATPSLNSDDDNGKTVAQKRAEFLAKYKKCPVGTRNNGHRVCIGTHIKRCAPGHLRVNGQCTPRTGINRNRCFIGSRKRDQPGKDKYLRCLNQTRPTCSPGTQWNKELGRCVPIRDARTSRCPVGQTRDGLLCLGNPRERCKDGTRMDRRLKKCRRKLNQNEENLLE